jgi:hypothetical protein
LLQRLFHDFAPQHIYGYAFVAKSLQLHVSLLFSAPRYDNYCKIWVYDGDEGFFLCIDSYILQLYNYKGMIEREIEQGQGWYVMNTIKGKEKTDGRQVL